MALIRRLCFGVLAAGCAASQEDASALVQSLVRAHSDRYARSSRSSSGLGRLLDIAAAAVGQRLKTPPSKSAALLPLLEDPNWVEPRDAFSATSGSVVFNTDDSEAELDGAFVVLTANQAGCDDCPFKFGDKVELLSVIHVPTAINTGDKVALSLDVTLDVANVDDPLSTVFMGDTFTFKGACQVCDGSCVLGSKKDADSFKVAFPTLIRSSDVCKGKEPRANLTDVVLMDSTALLPHLDMNWLQMSGHVNVSMSLLREGTALASTAVSLAFRPDGPSTGEVTQATGSAKTALAADDGEGSPLAPPGLLQTALGALLSNVAEEVEEASDDDLAEGLEGLELDEAAFPKEGAMNAIVSNLVVYDMENPTDNISVWSSGSCWKAGQFGSVGCKTKFGESYVWTANVNLATVVEQGSYMLLSVTPKVSGMMASVLKPFLGSLTLTELELPLCGEPVDIQMFGKWKRWSPPGCGYYGLKANFPGKEITLSSAAIVSPAYRIYRKIVPGLKINFAMLPPLSFTVRMQLHHYGAATIADFEYTLGLDVAMT